MEADHRRIVEVTTIEDYRRLELPCVGAWVSRAARCAQLRAAQLVRTRCRGPRLGIPIAEPDLAGAQPHKVTFSIRNHVMSSSAKVSP